MKRPGASQPLAAPGPNQKNGASQGNYKTGHGLQFRRGRMRAISAMPIMEKSALTSRLT